MSGTAIAYGHQEAQAHFKRRTGSTIRYVTPYATSVRDIAYRYTTDTAQPSVPYTGSVPHIA
eukprot:1610063-Rhodomonas_salina.1